MSIRLLRGASLTMAALAVSFAIAGPVSAAPGDNGTIKIDGVAFDDLPNNEPHVGCTFQVDFYGFDQGDLDAHVSFDAQPPSGTNPVPFTGDPDPFIGEDDASGGGSTAGLDASETYTLNVAGLTAHPKQGYHIKITVHADCAKGADTKYKVFWVTGCDPCDEPPGQQTN